MAKSNLTPGVIELDNSSLVDTKEHIRLDQIVPSEILADKVKLREFLEAYYTFMNMDEFIYQETKVFTDIILDNVARFRVANSEKNNEFFVDSGAGNSTLVLTSPTGKSPAKFIFDGSSSSIVDTTNNKLKVGNTNQGALPVGTFVKYLVGDGSAITGLVNDNNYFVVFSAGGEIQLGATAGGTPINLSNVGAGVLHSLEGVLETMTIPIDAINTAISNGNELPGSLQLTSEIGKTFTVTGLSSFNGYTATLTTLIKKYVGPGPSNVMNSIEKAMDIDLNDDNFLTMMQKEIGVSLPRNTSGNRRQLYKQIIDFYKLRGSSDSIEIFFRLLFNESVEVEFPYQKTLIPSEGDWDQALDHETTLSQAASNTAIINITASNENIKPGSKFTSGTTFTLVNAPTVSSVDATGKVITLSQAVTLSSGAPVTFVPRGIYLNQRGFLSYDQVITDSKKFQKFAYIVKTGRGLSDWENAFDKLVHPAGFIYFAEVLIFLQLTDSILGELLNKISMPTIQPGVIGIEDIPLLVEIFAAQFSPIAKAKIHKSGSLSLNLKDGVIKTATVTSAGSGYEDATNAAITLTDAASASGILKDAILVSTVTNGRLTDVAITDGGEAYGIPQGVVAPPTAIPFNPATAVSLSNNTITLTTAQLARLNDTDQVTYSNGSGGDIGNLTNGTTYFVRDKTSTTIKLAATQNGTAINLSTVGSGTSHTLTGKTATVTFTNENGQVKSIEIGEKGFGYSGSSISVSFSGQAEGSTTTPVASIGLTAAGELDVDNITITNPGGGFSALFASVAPNPNATKIASLEILGPQQKNFRSAPGISFPPPTAVDSEGVALSTNVTATGTFSINGDGHISGSTLTNAGLGYTFDPIVTVTSGAINELRARNQQEILILSLNHKMTNIHNGFGIDNFRTIINNGYKQRKGDNFYTSPRLFNSNQQISFLGDVEIQNVDTNNINKYNTRTFVEIE